MFQFRRYSHAYLCIQYTLTTYCVAGFPHSEICGSMDICSSPQLIAAYHVFHRLLVPRHPPCALYSLTCRIALSCSTRCDQWAFGSLLPISLVITAGDICEAKITRERQFPKCCKLLLVLLISYRIALRSIPVCYKKLVLFSDIFRYQPRMSL